jgi:hypothetical protein
MTHPANALHAHPDARIDQALAALRTAAPPSGLEQRIAARIANAAEARSVTTSLFASRTASPLAVRLNAVKDLRSLLAETPRYALAATSLVMMLAALSFFALHAHYPTPTRSQVSASILPLQPPARNSSTSASLDSAELRSHRNAPTRSPAVAAEGASRPAPVLSEASPTPTDPDAIALAETLAPSRPAPPMPLTQQELLTLAATRPGQPIQLAELDLARAPALRAAAEASEQASLQRYVKSMLAPFAVAEALSPNNFAEPQEISTSAPAPLPTISLAN